MMRLCHAKVCTNKSWAYKCLKGAFKKFILGRNLSHESLHFKNGLAKFKTELASEKL